MIASQDRLGFNCSFAIISSATCRCRRISEELYSFNCSFAIISSATRVTSATAWCATCSFNCSFAIISSATVPHDSNSPAASAFQLLIRNYFLCNHDGSNSEIAIVTAFQLLIRNYFLCNAPSAFKALVAMWFQLLIRNYFLCNAISDLYLFPHQPARFNCSFAIISSATTNSVQVFIPLRQVSIAHSQLFPLQQLLP